MPYFQDTNFDDIRGKLVLLDVDGTLTYDGAKELSAETVSKVEELAKKNNVHLCSNKKDHKRNESVAKQLGVGYIKTEYRKPSLKIVNFIDNPDQKQMVVIGDKWWTDGRFAEKIGAEFIRVKRIVGEHVPWSIRVTYWWDNLIYRLIRKRS